jgi:hypothetical protein
MGQRKTGRPFKLIGVMFFAFGAAQLAVAQSNNLPDDKEMLQELLSEVRMLRQAMQTLQRMSLDTYRSQAMVDQIRIEREDVRRLTTALNETRDMITKNTAAIHQDTDEQKLLESQIQSEVDS